MNPFKNMTPLEGLAKTPNSPYYGRYHIVANQVYPFREPIYDCVVLQLKDIEQALLIEDCLPDHLQFSMFNIRRSDFKIYRETLDHIDFLKTDEYFFEFSAPDTINIGIENIYFIFLEFSTILEDCHFFIYSPGDNDNRWLDEYVIKNNQLFFNRHLCGTHINWGRLDYYIKRAVKEPDDKIFVEFTLYQLYSKLYRATWQYDDSTKKRFRLLEKYDSIDKLNADDMVKNNLEYPYFLKLYQLDSECKDLYSLNAKYNFDKKMYKY